MMNQIPRFVFLAGLALAPEYAGAERAESLLHAPPAARNGQNASVPGFLGTDGQPLVIDVPVLQTDLASDIPGVPKTGIVYTLPAPITAAQPGWEPVDGGFAARIRLVAANARRLRFHVFVAAGIPPVEFRVQGDLDSAPLGPLDNRAIRENGLWLPITHGGSADLEIFVAGETLPDGLDDMILDRVNLILVDSSSPSSAVSPRSLGLAEKPERDLACWSGHPDYAGLKIAASATAKINFIKDGGSYICTGTLLNDKGSTGTPWFATANHCLNAQNVADTVIFEWFFQAVNCGGNQTDPRYRQTYGGAQLLRSDFTLDAAFLKLNSPPPPGVHFSGWDTAIRVNDPVWGVHHPQGDHVMASRGQVQSLGVTVADTRGGNHVLDIVDYADGGTEPGSSGSGLFAVTGPNAYWKGTLFGGPAHDYQIADYSPFRSYFGKIRSWLRSCQVPWGGSISGGQSITAYKADISRQCAALSEVRTCSNGVLGGSYAYPACSNLRSCALPWGGTIADGRSIKAYQIDVSPQCAALSEIRTCSDGLLSGSYGYATCRGVMTVLSPNGGEVFTAGETVPVQWNLQGYGPKSKVRIILLKNGGSSWTVLKPGVKNAGIWNWKVKRKQATSQASIRVCLPKAPKRPAVCDVSDDLFVINP